MARTGSALVIAILASTSALGAEAEITMQVDRPRIGIEDTFRLDVVVANVPQGASVSLPTTQDFEILGQSESTQMSYSVGPGGAGVVTHVQRFTLTMRANRTGKLQIPPASLRTSQGTIAAKNSITMEVVAGRLTPDRPQRRPQRNPFGFPPGFPGLDDDSPLDETPFDEPSVPTGDSDLFLRMNVDRSEVYVGEQVMLTIHLYSRVELSSVDSVIMPKLDGFLSQDFKTPTNLVSDQRVIGGIPYREYTLRQKAVFPLKAGTVTIGAPEADITTGLIFAGRRVHRKSNEVKLVVRPLPAGPQTNIVGQWRLSREVSQTEVRLGEPVQVKFIFEGRGNLQTLELPALQAPSAFKVFDPETHDTEGKNRTQLGGTRTIEYTLVPQQTGAFTLPAMAVSTFDPEARKYVELKVDAVTVTVKPQTNGSTVTGVPGMAPTESGEPKNQLVGGGLKSLRHTAHFSGERAAVVAQPWFLPLALAPLLATLLAASFLIIMGGLKPESEASAKKRQARAARKRLAGADSLMHSGSATEFYAEVERALTSFLSARLGTPVVGLVRADLLTKLTEAGVTEEERQRVARVLETCDVGRYAPGMGDAAARKRAVDDAAQAMEGWS